MRSEAAYQKTLIDKLEVMFDGCLIQKQDPASRQGLPDLLILWGPRWAMLEVKCSARSPVQPNQEYYVNHFSQMSFSSFIYPEIEADVLHDLHNFMHS
jgi:hypothetical protein